MTDIAVIFGSNGFIGTRLVRCLSKERGMKVRAFDINPPRVTLPDVDYEILDVRKAIPKKFGISAQSIYNLAAVHRTPGHPECEYYDTNVAGAINITEFADENGIETILFTSSISVYGPSEEIMCESSQLKPISAYGRSKLLAEEIHRGWFNRNPGQRRLAIARPGVVFGPGERGNYTNLARALQRGVFAFPGRKDVVKSGGYVDELVSAIEFALAAHERYVLFNFAYPKQNSLQDIVSTLSGILGKKANYPLIPTPPMLAAAWPFEILNSLGVKNPIHRERIHKLVRSTKIAPNWLVSNGYAFKTDLERALRSWSAETEGRFD